MISLASEQLILLGDVPGRLPRRPGGKKLHVSAVYRWVKAGVQGVVLESVRLGGATYTSIEALQRFAEAQSRGGQREATARALPQTRHRHQRSVAAALESELAYSGAGRP